MLIKSADDKSRRLLLLEELQKSDRLDERQKKWLREQFWRLKPGLKGEKDAAHYLDLSFSFSKNHAVLHDLRLKHEGKVAQIDHLVVDRTFTFFLLETKNYNGSFHINDFGEFSVEYANGQVYEIESPIEQSRRHQIALKNVLEQLSITGRFGTDPKFVHVVLIHPKGKIHRPPKDAFDTTNVIKADNFATWHEAYIEKQSSVAMLPGMLNLRGRDTVKEWGELLKGKHRPENPLDLPDFMKPGPAPKVPVVRTLKLQTVNVSPKPNSLAKCAMCEKVLTEKAEAYCRANANRFEGRFYCFAHQKKFKPST